MQNVKEAEQDKNDAENEKDMNLTKDAKGYDDNATVAKVDSLKVASSKVDNVPADTPVVAKVLDLSTASTQKHEQQTKPTVNKKKPNFGGLKKGFLL